MSKPAKPVMSSALKAQITAQQPGGPEAPPPSQPPAQAPGTPPANSDDSPPPSSIPPFDPSKLSTPPPADPPSDKDKNIAAMRQSFETRITALTAQLEEFETIRSQFEELQKRSVVFEGTKSPLYESRYGSQEQKILNQLRDVLIQQNQPVQKIMEAVEAGNYDEMDQIQDPALKRSLYAATQNLHSIREEGRKWLMEQADNPEEFKKKNADVVKQRVAQVFISAQDAVPGALESLSKTPMGLFFSTENDAVKDYVTLGSERAKQGLRKGDPEYLARAALALEQMPLLFQTMEYYRKEMEALQGKVKTTHRAVGSPAPRSTHPSAQPATPPEVTPLHARFQGAHTKKERFKASIQSAMEAEFPE